jgi:hypothetical protein
MKRIIVTFLICFLAVVGVTTVTDVMAKKQTRNDFTGRRQYIANSILDITNDFTTGSIIFGGASSLTEDNDNLFWDDTNDRLGIGTSTPSASLDVTGTVITGSGVIRETTRITSNTTLDSTYHKVICDTDGGAFTVTLPVGVDGREYPIFNTGSNDVTVTPNGAEFIDGVNASKAFGKGMVTLTYETTEGWW